MSFSEWSPIHLPHKIYKKPWIKHNKNTRGSTQGYINESFHKLFFFEEVLQF
jgi:hypothetical protein